MQQSPLAPGPGAVPASGRATVLVCSTPITAHTLNATLVVRGLVRRGVRVLWVADERFREHVTAQGAEHVRWCTDRPDAPGLATAPASTGWRAAGTAARMYRDDLVAPASGRADQLVRLVRREGVDVLLADTLCLAAAPVAEHMGLPWASLGDGPLAWPDVQVPPFGTGLPVLAGAPGRHRNRTVRRVVNEVLFRDALRELNRLRARLGLWPVADALSAGISRHCHLQGGVPALEHPRADWPGFVHFVGALGPGTGHGTPLPAPLRRGSGPHASPDAGRRPVALVTQGTLRTARDELVRPACTALLADGWDVVVAGMQAAPEHLATGHCWAVPRLDLEDAWPHLDLLVSNGGWTTTTLALAHGVPVVLCGSTEEKPDIGVRVQAAGVGVHLRRSRPGVARLRGAVRAVHGDPAVAAAVARVRDDFERHDAAMLGAGLVLGLVGSRAEGVRDAG